MVYTAPQLSYPYDATITDVLLDYNFNQTPLKKPAIIDGPTGKTIYTYGSLRSSVKRLASHLSQSITKASQEIIAVLVSNTNHFPVFVHAVLATGCVLSAFNPLYKPQEIAHSLMVARPRYVFVEPTMLDPLLEGISIANLGYFPQILVWTEEETPHASAVAAQCASFNDIQAIKDGSPDFAPKKLTPEEVGRKLAFICFSSGTSGLAKGVQLTHGNVVANIFQQTSRLRDMFTPQTVTVIVVPFFHILGLAAFSIQFISQVRLPQVLEHRVYNGKLIPNQGAPIVVFKRFNLPLLLRAIKLTHINIVPPIAIELLRNSATKAGDFSSVCCLMNAGASLKENVSDEVSQRLRCVITQWYGMTEASPSIATQLENEVSVRGTVGKMLPGMQLRVVGDNGTECATEETGELQIRGPNITPGYIGVQATQDATTSDGFFKTGDIGYINDRGYIYIVDRAKEMIKVKANQVAPAELEAVLLSHPQVDDAAVRGVHINSEATDYPTAFITTKVDAALHDNLRTRVRTYVDSRVAPYKRLRGGVHILDQIPRNPSGKILRRLLPTTLPFGGSAVPAKL